MKYTLGLDLGITSIGWAMIGLDDDGNSTHIIDANVTTLESIEDDKGELKNVERRTARGIRRTIRRRAYRVARVKGILEDIGVNVDGLYNIKSKKQYSPYYLKVKGLNNELTKEELSICLIHYAKHRGFKSNRKDKSVSDEGDLLTSISENKLYLIEKDITISQFLYEKYIESNGSNKIKNTTGNYQYLFDRETYLEEIEILLKNQVKLGVVTEEFKEKFIKIWESQRDFSEGPGEPSEYAVDFSKTFGYCKFPIDGVEQLRAPKCAPTTEIFTLLQKLTNIRYVVMEQLDEIEEKESKAAKRREYKRLSASNVESILSKAKDKASLTYGDIDKILGGDIIFQGLDLPTKKFNDLVFKYKEDNKISKEDKIDFKDESFIKLLNAEKKKVVVGKLTNFHSIKKAFKDNGYENDFLAMPLEYLDDIVTGLTFYKTENKISNYFCQEGGQEFSELDWNLYPEIVNNVIPKIKTFNESASLSLKLMRKLNPLLIEGNDYYEAMKKLGYDHYAPAVEREKSELLPDMSIVINGFPNELTNPRVSRVLSATMALINSLIKRYGKPTNIHIETARDIANKRNKRGQIFNENMNNYEYNQRLKYTIANELKVKSIDKVSKDDIEKLKLFYEQNEYCMYSFEKIDIDKLFSTDVQVDHIIPYSRSFNNSYSNKTLVLTKYNQDKRNRTPYEYFKQDRSEDYSKFVNSVESNFKISSPKKKNYLASEITEEFKTRSLNDTNYITEYLIKILNTYMEVDGDVVGYKAGIVNSLKKSWDLQYLTHSLINSEYSSRDVSKYVGYKLEKDYLKFEFENNLVDKNIVLELKRAKIIEKTPKEIVELDNALEEVLKNPEFLLELDQIMLAKDEGKRTVYNMYMEVVKTESLNQYLKNKYILIMNQIKIDYDKAQIKKDRDNHLHHVLDAACVGVLNRKFEKAVTSFYQEMEEIKIEAKKEFDNNRQYTNKMSGTVVNNFEALNNDIDNMWYDQFPKPYKNFDLEAKLRIYEQDDKKQKERFGVMFNDSYERNIRPVFPVYKGIKRKTMKLHKETYYGSMKFEDGEFLTKRVDVNTITTKNIEKIVEIKRGNKQLKEIITNWLANKQTEYPMLPNGRPIKKVKMIDKTIDKSIQIAEGKYVGVDKVARIDIYKSPNDEKLYFVQRNPISLNAEMNGEDFAIQLWWGRDKNVKTMLFSELSNYTLYKKIYPGQLIYLKTKDGESHCYASGFGSGMLEVKSILGDGQDLISRKLSGKVKLQYQITISTIKSIDKVSINNLGEIGKHF